jgi:hypothetical protein
MRLVLFKAHSQYGSQRLHVDQLAAALVAQGHDVRVVDLLEAAWREALTETFSDLPDCYFGFNGIGSDLKNGDTSLYDQFGVVYASLYLDHPLYHVGRITTKIRRHAVLLLDRSHLQFLRAWPKMQGVSYLGFLPPGANETSDSVDTSDAAFALRDIAVLFTGSYRGAPEPVWTSWAESPAKEIVAEVADRMEADGRISVLDALKATLAERDVDLDGELLDQLIPLLRFVQAFIEARHRDKLMHGLGRAGAPLHLYGAGWEPLAAAYPAFTYGGVGSFEETLSLLRRSRIVLNTNNGFVAGGHERVFTAMCGGAAVFSDFSRYYAEAFKEGREIATFEWSAMSDAPAKLFALIDDPVGTGAIARAGHKRAMGEHRWADRAAKLVKIVKQVR